MIAIEATYVELCKYTVAYGLTSYKKAQLSQRGRATHVDPSYVSPGDAWFDGSAVHHYGLVLVELNLVRSEGEGVALFVRKFRMERVSPYQPFLAWSVSGKWSCQ